MNRLPVIIKLKSQHNFINLIFELFLFFSSNIDASKYVLFRATFHIIQI